MDSCNPPPGAGVEGPSTPSAFAPPVSGVTASFSKAERIARVGTCVCQGAGGERDHQVLKHPPWGAHVSETPTGLVYHHALDIVRHFLKFALCCTNRLSSKTASRLSSQSSGIIHLGNSKRKGS